MDRTFIKYSEALKILEENKTFFSTISVPINESGGRYLAEDLIADRDFPPYHRVTMDGIAIRHRTFENGATFFKIQEVAPAGSIQKTLADVNDCINYSSEVSNSDSYTYYEKLLEE